MFLTCYAALYYYILVLYVHKLVISLRLPEFLFCPIQLCPLYPHNPEVLLNELKSPSELLDFGEFSDCLDFASGTGSPLIHVVNPAFDYVPPNLVSLFITDT